MGTLRKRGDRYWIIVVELPRLNGRRRQSRSAFKGTKREAQRELTRLQALALEPTYADSGRMTVALLLQRWLDSSERALSTQRRYKGVISHNINPVLGSKLIAKLSPLDVEDAIKSWQTMPRKDRKRGHAGLMSGRTIHHIFSTLRSACNYGVRTRLMSSNPCAYVTPPKKPKSTVKAGSADQAILLWEGLAETSLATPTLLTLCSGVRRGELLAIHNEDVDLERRTLLVRRSLTFDDYRVPVLKETKSDRWRTINIPSFAVPWIKAHMKENIWKTSPFLVPNPENGEAWMPDVFSSAYYYRVRALRLPAISVQGLRHSFATVLLRAKVPLKVVSEILGHATVALTGDTYSHVLDEMREDAAAEYDAVMFAAYASRKKNRMPNGCPSDLQRRAKPYGMEVGFIAPTGFEPVLPP